MKLVQKAIRLIIEVSNTKFQSFDPIALSDEIWDPRQACINHLLCGLKGEDNLTEAVLLVEQCLQEALADELGRQGVGIEEYNTRIATRQEAGRVLRELGNLFFRNIY
jgi:hypothetical protein